MLVIPAIDLLGGRCVRLTQGDYSRQTDYGADPVKVAAAFEQEGAPWLHVVDLDGARAGVPHNLDTLSRIRENTRMKMQFGGGVRSAETLRAVLGLGADRVVVGTRLVQDESAAEELFQEFGESVVAGIDARNGVVAVQGWTESGGLEAVGFAVRLQELGCRRVVFTDIARDGSLEGPNLPALRAMVGALRIPVVASGGVSRLEDLGEIRDQGAEAVIIGKALYEGRFTLRAAFSTARKNTGHDPLCQ